MITLIHGVNKLNRDDLANLSIETIKQDYEDALSISSHVTVKVNGTTVNDLGRVAQDGDVIEFVKMAGEKGQL